MLIFVKNKNKNKRKLSLTSMTKDLWFNPSSSVTSSYIHKNVNRCEVKSSMTHLHQSVRMTNEDPHLLNKLDILNQKFESISFWRTMSSSIFHIANEMYPPYSSPAHYVRIPRIHSRSSASSPRFP